MPRPTPGPQSTSGTVHQSPEARRFQHPIYCHQDVLVALAPRDKGAPGTPVSKKLNEVLQRLAVFGRTTTVKSVRGSDNEGWLRSPLGGNGGNQFYLWWTRAKSRHAASFPIESTAIVARSIRHHDDHTPLSAGKFEDYDSMYHQADVDYFIESPWTKTQQRFAESTVPVRLLIGSPGSGKTTGLYRAIETQTNRSVLYVTWSQKLADEARQRFQNFAHESVRVEVLSFHELLELLLGSSVPLVDMAHSRVLFRRLIGAYGSHRFNLWDKSALHDEVRGFYLGRAIPGEVGVVDDGPVAHLDPQHYQSIRTPGTEGEITLDEERAKQVTELMTWVQKNRISLEKAFPELAAATQSIRLLRSAKLPSSFPSFDILAVDEVQDLTLLELAVLVETILARERLQGQRPWLLLAGDEAQTVRPSGFSWGSCKLLLGRRLGKPEELRQHQVVRTPPLIAKLMENLGDVYRTLPKDWRPSKRQDIAETARDLPSHVAHFTLNPKQLESFFDKFAGHPEDIALVLPHESLPSWLPAKYRDRVSFPAQIKGLEWQTVCVLGVGDVIGTRENPSFPDEIQQARMTIDRLRVAISRATSTLILVDIQDGPPEAFVRSYVATERLFRDVPAASVESLDELQEFIEGEIEELPCEQVQRWTQRARAAREDGQLDLAWSFARQAVMRLSPDDSSFRCEDATQRSSALGEMLCVGALVLGRESDGPVGEREVEEQCRLALDMFGSSADISAFQVLSTWTRRRDSRAAVVTNLLDEATRLGEGGGWLAPFLEEHSLRLREELEQAAGSSSEAPAFSGEVESWLRTLGENPEDAQRNASQLRVQAVQSLLDAGRLKHVDALLDRLPDTGPVMAQLHARVREAQGQFVRAARLFEQAGERDLALRCWRKAGEWNRALTLGAEEDQRDILWLIEIEKLAESRPEALDERLTDEERARLRQILARLAGSTGS